MVVLALVRVHTVSHILTKDDVSSALRKSVILFIRITHVQFADNI